MFNAKGKYVQNQITKDGVTVEYQKEDLSQVNPQLYKWLSTINGNSSSNNSVTKFTPNVKYSIKENNGNKFTPNADINEIVNSDMTDTEKRKKKP